MMGCRRAHRSKYCVKCQVLLKFNQSIDRSSLVSSSGLDRHMIALDRINTESNSCTDCRHGGAFTSHEHNSTGDHDQNNGLTLQHECLRLSDLPSTTSFLSSLHPASESAHFQECFYDCTLIVCQSKPCFLFCCP